MPNNLINKVCQVCDMPQEKAEELWAKAEDIVNKQYKKTDKNSQFYQLVVGVFKKAIGKDCANKLHWNKQPVLEEIDLLMELTRWKKQAMLTHGGTKLFNATINAGKAIYKGVRLSKQAISKLKNAGVVKSHADWSAGMNKGSENMVKKYGTVINNLDLNQKSKAHFNPNTNTIHTTNDPRQKRHEARESVEFHKDNDLPITTVFNGTKQVGQHHTPKVLQDEKKNVDVLKTLHRDKLSNMDYQSNKHRKKTGEYSPFIQNVKHSDIIQKFNQKNNKYKEFFSKFNTHRGILTNQRNKITTIRHNLYNAEMPAEKFLESHKRLNKLQSKIDNKLSDMDKATPPNPNKSYLKLNTKSKKIE